MPIVVQYAPEAGVIGQTAYGAGDAMAEERRARILDALRQQERGFHEDRRRFYTSLGENQRQFDTGIALRAEEDQLRNQLAYQQLGQNAYQFDQQLGQRAYQSDQDRALRYELGQMDQQRLANYADAQLEMQRQSQQARMNSQQVQIAAQFARDQQKRRFEEMMADRNAIDKWTGYKDNAQKQQAIDMWQQKYGQDWMMPIQQMNEEQDAQARRQAIVPWMGDVDDDGNPLFTEEELNGFVMPDGQGGYIFNDKAYNTRAGVKLKVMAEKRQSQKNEDAAAEAIRTEQAKQQSEAAKRQQELEDAQRDAEAKQRSEEIKIRQSIANAEIRSETQTGSLTPERRQELEDYIRGKTRQQAPTETIESPSSIQDVRQYAVRQFFKHDGNIYLKESADMARESSSGLLVPLDALEFGAIPAVNSPEDIKRLNLKSGDRFLAPDGTIRVVP